MAAKRKHSTIVEEAVPYVFKPFQFTKYSTVNSAKDSGIVPYARRYHQIVTNERYLYLIGGENSQINETHPYYSKDAIWQDSRPFFRELWRFDKISHVWANLPVTGDVPDGLENCNAFLWDCNQLLVYGSGDEFYDEFYVCQLDKLIWTRIPQANFKCGKEGLYHQPPSTLGQVMIADRAQKLIFLCTGYCQEGHHLNLYCFCYKTRKWRLLTKEPEGLKIKGEQSAIVQGMAYYQNKLYVIYGIGIDQELTPVFASTKIRLAVYDINQKQWTITRTKPFRGQYGPMSPFPRHFPRTCQHSNLLFLAGGEMRSINFTDIWSLNLETLQWTRHLSLETPCHLPEYSMTISEQGELTIFDVFNKLENYSAEVYSAYISTPTMRLLARNAMLHLLTQKNAIEAAKKKRNYHLRHRRSHSEPATIEQLEKFMFEEVGLSSGLQNMIFNKPEANNFFSLV